MADYNRPCIIRVTMSVAYEWQKLPASEQPEEIIADTRYTGRRPIRADIGDQMLGIMAKNAHGTDLA